MEKQESILYHAMHEFALHGYDNASTNQIAKAADLSKGLIFHYYPTKEALFHASIERALKQVNESFQGSFTYASKDLFERLVELMHYKSLLLINPDPAVVFISSLALQEDHALINQVRSLQERFNGYYYEQLFEGLDMQHYRDDFTLSEMMELSLMVLEKAGERLMANAQNTEAIAEQLSNEMQPWIQKLQRLFLKETL